MAQKTSSMITVETTIQAPVEKVWAFWNGAEHIRQWCAASDDWWAPKATNDVNVGGKFSTTMAAKDGSASFDFSGKYTAVTENKLIEYTMDDGRKAKLIFERTSNGTKIIESFDPENENPAEMQRGGWQAILDNFKKYVELTLNSKTPMLTPYLNFNGDCRQAMLFYSGIFGGFLAMQTFGESGMAKKSADNDRIIHATLKTADLNFMASDGRPDLTVKFGDSVAMSLGGSDEKKLRGFFKKLSVGGNVTMPLEKQFWGDVFGMLTDRFGVHWMVNISQQKL